jgi:transketolase
MGSDKLIKRIIDLSYTSKEGHIPSSLSVLDILYVLYGKILKNEDRFILSKGHASLGLYVILEHFNLLEYNLDDFCKYNSSIGGHPSNKLKHIEASTGSLGHGLPIAVGIAMGEKIQKTNNKVFVVIGDGESNEGTIWESALLASNHNLNNLYCIMDYNHSNDRALKLDSVINKFNAFNWHTIEIDGHNENEIIKALETNSDKPIFILANTVKGKGISIIENNPEWHHKIPNDEEYKKLINTIYLDKINLLIQSSNNLGQTFQEVFNLVNYVIETRNIIGDIAEVGVYSGDSAKILEYFKDENKKLYLFDTFEGLKDCGEKDGDYLKNGFLFYDYNSTIERFKNNDSVIISKGYFPEETGNILNDKKFSFVHLDVDTYQSTFNCLNYFYDKMSSHGIFIIHDYTGNNQTEGVSLAVDEFFKNKLEKPNIIGTSQCIIIKQ